MQAATAVLGLCILLYGLSLILVQCYEHLMVVSHSIFQLDEKKVKTNAAEVMYFLSDERNLYQ